VPGGRLAIDWRVEGEPGARQVRLGWRESGGPAITPPNEQGFGTKLIERACAHELGGKAELHYAPDGLACEVRFPID